MRRRETFRVPEGGRVQYTRRPGADAVPELLDTRDTPLVRVTGPTVRRRRRDHVRGEVLITPDR
jgi:hypothetical protein